MGDPSRSSAAKNSSQSGPSASPVDSRMASVAVGPAARSWLEPIAPRKAAASLQCVNQHSCCQPVKPGVRCATSSTISLATVPVPARPVPIEAASTNSASSWSCAVPSAIHHGQMVLRRFPRRSRGYRCTCDHVPGRTLRIRCWTQRSSLWLSDRGGSETAEAPSAAGHLREGDEEDEFLKVRFRTNVVAGVPA